MSGAPLRILQVLRAPVGGLFRHVSDLTRELRARGHQIGVGGGGGKLKQADREKSLQALMTVNLLKRLESSVASFRFTLQSLQSNHQQALDKIIAFRKSGKSVSFTDQASVFEDAEQMAMWSQKSYQCARRAAKAKTAPKK